MDSTKMYQIKVIREPGNDPVTGEFYERAEHEFNVKASSRLGAALKAVLDDTLVFRGQLRRTFIDGEEYFDERY